MLNHKKSMRMKTDINFQVGKLIDIDPCQDEKDEPIKKKGNQQSYIKDLTTLRWGTKFKICTKSNMNEIIDEQYTESNTRFENLNDDVGGSGWIINRLKYIFVDS